MLNLTSADRVLSVSRFTFDLSVWDIFGMFAAGGAIVLPDQRRRLDAAHWLELMCAHKVTVWNSVPRSCRFSRTGSDTTKARTCLPCAAPC